MKLPLVILCLGAVLILGGYAAYWYYVAGRLQAGIEDWAQQQRALGHEIAFSQDAISGFPFAFRRDFQTSALTWHQGAFQLSATAEHVSAEMRPWDLRSVEFSARRVGLATPQGNYAAESVQATINLPAIPPMDYHQPLISFDTTVTALRLPPGQRAVTTEPIVKVAASGAIMGPVPASNNLHDAVAGWASAGGVIELKSFDFVQAPLTLAGEGTVTLDEALQPLGALTINAQGLPETIALLRRDGVIDAQAAKTGGMMAQGLAKPDAAGHQVVTVSLSLQQGYLWLGPVKLARLPALGW